MKLLKDKRCNRLSSYVVVVRGTTGGSSIGNSRRKEGEKVIR
jgi:hypothetical protein